LRKAGESDSYTEIVMVAQKLSSPAFVLDCSVTLRWFFADEVDAYADAVAHVFPSASAIVPGIWPLEVANALLMGERRKRSTIAQASKWLDHMRSLPIAVDEDTTARAWSEIVSLGRSQGLSAYDAAYLELALRRGLPLASLDERLKGAADAIGVNSYQP
jgi:predicted nucleic acid-binding protein